MEEKEMEIFTDIMRKCGVNTKKHTWSELEDIAKAMKAYHQAKLKLLGIGDVVNQRELLLDFADYSESDKTSQTTDECVDNYLDSIK